MLTIVVLATGWMADRTIHFRRAEEVLDRNTFGAGRFSQTWTSIHAARAYRDASPSELKLYFKSELFGCIQNTWRYHDRIDAVTDDAWSAIRLANESMKLLECKTPDDFFAFAVDFLPDENDGLFPELHDTDSEQHKSLRKFLEAALLEENEIQWGP
ncbi:hypothetical protein [Mariniblastus fucicola]|uniref:Uncharacterized protein n=1 Tax=Mariniblastus fucicola TaxID=980251 RepID=A0A5B9P6N5_9BACT|nr:hypothetical protein [Mariniblastus fucicola]QEG22267.1 hypothetical protein MFFC18_21430 [Mariniblastus fucicola]